MSQIGTEICVRPLDVLQSSKAEISHALSEKLIETRGDETRTRTNRPDKICRTITSLVYLERDLLDSHLSLRDLRRPVSRSRHGGCQNEINLQWR